MSRIPGNGLGIPNIGQPQPSAEDRQRAAQQAIAIQVGAMSAGIYVQAASDFIFCGKAEDRSAEFARMATGSLDAAKAYFEALSVRDSGD